MILILKDNMYGIIWIYLWCFLFGIFLSLNLVIYEIVFLFREKVNGMIKMYGFIYFYLWERD